MIQLYAISSRGQRTTRERAFTHLIESPVARLIDPFRSCNTSNGAQHHNNLVTMHIRLVDTTKERP
jgi:hypothetical protein